MTLRSIVASLSNWLRPSTAPAPSPPDHSPPLPAEMQVDAARFLDDSSLSHGAQPVFRLIVGGVCTGKTTMRRAQCAEGFVVLDASEVFLALSQGEVVDFPSTLADRMNLVGGLVARRAVREKRHLVMEVLGHDAVEWEGLITVVTTAGYRVEVQLLTCDPFEAVRRNQARGDDSVSAYFAQPFHLAWVKAAIVAEGCNS